ncbi:hypothetical protein O8W32_01535 [Methanomassiliicoccales archaeon LGM-DZ1]|nr:hypothetical protein O8W32_01535 [Methanomassiliicoccales archaeon LGM-DZ1]
MTSVSLPLTKRQIIASLSKVKSDPYVQEVFRKHPKAEQVAKQQLDDCSTLIIENVKRLKKDRNLRPSKIMDYVLHNMEMEIHNLPPDSPHIEYLSNYLEKPPHLLYKYVSREVTQKDLEGQNFRFGLVEEYRVEDEHELDLISALKKVSINEKRFSFTRILYNALGTQVLSLEKFSKATHTTIGKHFFVGCISEAKYSAKLWEKRAGDYGSRLTFDISESKFEFHKVVYCNHPINTKYIEDKESSLCERLSKEQYDDVRADLESFLKELALLGIMSAFRKDTKWKWEREWRAIKPKRGLSRKLIWMTKTGLGYFPKEVGKIIQVYSKMPLAETNDVKKYCRKNHITFRHYRYN